MNINAHCKQKYATVINTALDALSSSGDVCTHVLRASRLEGEVVVFDVVQFLLTILAATTTGRSLLIL